MSRFGTRIRLIWESMTTSFLITNFEVNAKMLLFFLIRSLMKVTFSSGDFSFVLDLVLRIFITSMRFSKNFK